MEINTYSLRLYKNMLISTYAMENLGVVSQSEVVCLEQSLESSDVPS